MNDLKDAILLLPDLIKQGKKAAGKTAQERTILKKAEKFYKDVSKYIKSAPRKTFAIASDGKAKPQPTTRELEPETIDEDKVVLADNAETPEAVKEQKTKRKTTRKRKKKE